MSTMRFVIEMPDELLAPRAAATSASPVGVESAVALSAGPAPDVGPATAAAAAITVAALSAGAAEASGADVNTTDAAIDAGPAPAP
jgi:hypothetical protein